MMDDEEALETESDSGKKVPASASCPVCAQPFPLNSMIAHIDLCLLAAESLTQQSEDGKAASGGKTDGARHKRSSPAPYRARPGPIHVKQSLLGFGKDVSELSSAGSQSPPAKGRKLTASSTPKSSRQVTSRQDE